MKPKELSEAEQKLLSDDFARVKRSLLTRAGMLNASNVGRPKDKRYAPLVKYPEVVKLLEQGLSLRKISEETGVAINTIRKVKKLLRLFS